MAQPIQYSDVPAQALLSLSQQRDRQDLLMQKAQMEDRKAAAIIPYDFAKQIKNLDRQVAEGLGAQYQANLANASMAGAGVSDLRRMAGEYLTDLNTKSNSIKAFRNQGQEYIDKMAPSLGIDKGRASQILSGYVATNFMDPDKLSDPAAVLNDAIKKAPDMFVDNQLGASVFTDIMKNAPRYTLSGESNMNPTGLEKKVLDWRSSQPWFFDFETVVDKKTGGTFEQAKLKTGPDGNVDEDVFQYFYNSKQSDMDFRMKTWIDAGAYRLMFANNQTKQPGDKDYIDPNNPVAIENLKRKYLTDQINLMKVGSFDLGKTVQVPKPTQPRKAAAPKATTKKTAPSKSGLTWK